MNGARYAANVQVLWALANVLAPMVVWAVAALPVAMFFGAVARLGSDDE